MRAGGVTLTPGPLYHAGPFITTWQCLLSGGTAVVMTRFDASEALVLVEKHRVEWVLFVPTMMQRIWRLPTAERERFDSSSLVRVMCTGAPSPVWLKRAWIGWLEQRGEDMMLHDDLPMRDTAIAGPRTWLLVDRNEAREFLEPVGRDTFT